MAIESFRLRIELNSMIKFYVKINSKCLLSDLKKLINSILSKDYGISLPSYSLRSIDGFEILEIFRLCDILDDNQILVIDAFTNSNRNKHTGDRMISASIENSTDKIYEKSNIRERSEFYDRGPQRRPLRASVDQDLGDINHELHTGRSRIEIPTEQPAMTELKVEKRVIGKPSLKEEKIEDPKIQRIEENIEDSKSIKAQETKISKSETKIEDLKSKKEEKLENSTTLDPPRPENFKGFVIKKTDLNKKQTITIDDSSFKPLKKRKVEVEEFDLN